MKKLLKQDIILERILNYLQQDITLNLQNLRKELIEIFPVMKLLALGFVAASVKSGLPLFLGSYPITPASDILHELSKHKNFGVRTFQAEDEIAAVTAAIGASFSGALAITTTSGPGVALKTEAIGLAVMTELPFVIIDVQRGGPSTGLPTKTEQSDLLQAMLWKKWRSSCCNCCSMQLRQIVLKWHWKLQELQ